MAEKIDSEISALLRKAQQTAKRLIETNRAKLNLLAGRLISEETLEGDDLKVLLAGPAEDAPLTA